MNWFPNYNIYHIKKSPCWWSPYLILLIFNIFQYFIICNFISYLAAIITIIISIYIKDSVNRIK